MRIYKVYKIFQILDDARGNISDSVGTVEITAHGVCTIVLVYNVSLGHQCGDPWLLFTGNR